MTIVKIVQIFWISVLACLGKASAFKFGAGFSAIEEGDDRFRGAFMLHMAPNDFYFGRFYLYGRDHGPVKERTYLVNVSRRMQLDLFLPLTASVGLSLLKEDTKVSFSGANSLYDEHDEQYNFGASYGVYWTLDSNPLYFSIGWESHLFPAGQAAIFLVTARKHALNLALGTSF